MELGWEEACPGLCVSEVPPPQPRPSLLGSRLKGPLSPCPGLWCFCEAWRMLAPGEEGWAHYWNRGAFHPRGEGGKPQAWLPEPVPQPLC